MKFVGTNEIECGAVLSCPNPPSRLTERLRLERKKIIICTLVPYIIIIIIIIRSYDRMSNTQHTQKLTSGAALVSVLTFVGDSDRALGAPSPSCEVPSAALSPLKYRDSSAVLKAGATAVIVASLMPPDTDPLSLIPAAAPQLNTLATAGTYTNSIMFIVLNIL